MRRILVLLVLVLVLGALLYQFLSAQQGYLLLSTGDYVMETTLWGALVILAGALLVLWLLYHLLSALAFPRRWWRSRRQKKQLKNRDLTAQGVVDYLEGNWPRAIANLSSGATHSATPGVNYLGAAAACFHTGDEAQCQSWLTAAEEKSVDPVAIGLMRVRIHLQNRAFDKALAQAQLLHRKSPSHPTVLRLLAESRRGVGDWQGLESLLPDLRRHKALSAEELEELERAVYLALLDAFPVTKTATKAPGEQRAELDQLWQTLPGKLKKAPAAVAAYVRQMQLLGMPEKAEGRLRSFINKHWDDGLVLLYGDIDGDAATQLRVAESWLKDHPDNPFLLETLGKLCMRRELWGKGKEYFEMSLKKNPQPRTWLALGELMQHLKDPQGSIECYRQGLGQVVGAKVERVGSSEL